MINLPTKAQLDRLQNFNEQFCLTIYVAFDEQSKSSNPNRIMLKNMLQDAEKLLKTEGFKPQQAKSILKPANSLLEDKDLWTMRNESLALFIHHKLFRYYLIPKLRTSHQPILQTGFDLKPLIKIMSSNKRYLVLGLNHSNVQLFEGDKYHIKTLFLKNFPANMEKALRIDERPRRSGTHRIAPASQGKGSEARHSRYEVSQKEKDMLLRFFRQIDKRLHKHLETEQDPLILAGVEYLIPIYRQANTYNHLQGGFIKGNLENTKPDAIRKQALALLRKNSRATYKP